MNEVMNASRYDYMQTSGDATFDEGHGHAHGGGGARSAFDRGALTNWCVARGAWRDWRVAGSAPAVGRPAV